MSDEKPYLGFGDFEATQLRHSSRKIGDYAYRVTLYDGQVLPGSIPFGSIGVGNTSPLVPVAITNMGIKPLPINAITCVGDFSISHNCPVGGTLAKGQSCTLQIQFVPQRDGACTGGAYIDTGDSMGTEFTKLNGVGIVANPTISISDATLVSTIVGG